MKTKFDFKSCLFIIVIFGLLACESHNNIEENITPKRVGETRTLDNEEMPYYSENDEIVLGVHRNNPYEIDNMRNAYNMLSHIRHNFIVGAEEPEVNMIYYRVLPSDSNELATLSADTTVMYFDYPLDYDIAQWGSYYHDPSVSDSCYTWLYAVVPVDHTLPNLASLEILQECYLPNEPCSEDDDEYDAIPDWQNGYALLEYVAYRESGNADMFEESDRENLENILASSADWGVCTPERARRSGGFWSWLRDCITGVHPEGDFYVRTEPFHDVEGIKNAHVFIHNFIKIYCGPIDSNGHYYSLMRFRTRVWYHIRFQNHHTKTSIYGGLKFLLGPVHRHLGWHSRYGFSCTLGFEDTAWRYASINNAVETYFNYCQEEHILFPYFIRVWVLGGMDEWAGSTPLFHKRLSPLIYNPIIWPLVAPFDIPDMLLFVSREDYDYQTLQIYDLVFHEFAHASHYEHVGPLYWMAYVLHIMEFQGYGGIYEGIYAGYCGIGEMWGNFAGACFMYKYLGINHPYIYIMPNSTSLNYSMYYGLGAHPSFHPREGWYNPGILAKIHEDSGCSMEDIYNALNADVHSLEALKYSLMLQGIDENIITAAYEQYNYWNE